MVYSYKAFGLCLKSEIALPELMEEDGDCDVTIRFGKADLTGVVKASGSFYRATVDEIQFFSKEYGNIIVRQGRDIIIESPPNADEAALRFPITGAALASILQHRGLLVFHASAVVIDGKAAMFLGTPGSGKSTIAAVMHSFGYRVLSDEIVAVQAEGDMPVVLSGLPQIRLLPESTKYIGFDSATMPKIKSDEDKTAYSAKKGFTERSVPLKRVYVLKIGRENNLETMGPQLAFTEMINNYYTVGMLKASGAPSHLKHCAKVISTVPVKGLSRADGLSHMADLIDLVKMDMLND